MKQMAKNNPSMGHSHSNSLLLSPGEKGELVWKFSNKVKTWKLFHAMYH